MADPEEDTIGKCAARLQVALEGTMGRLSVGMDADGNPNPKSLLQLVVQTKRQNLLMQRDLMMASAMLEIMEGLLPAEQQALLRTRVEAKINDACVALEKAAAAQRKPASGLVLPPGAGKLSGG